jgi:magnesium transporter
MNQSLAHSDRPVRTVARTDFIVLRQDLPVHQALDAIRQRDLGERIVYFYIVDERDRLVGVVPIRRLLTATLDQRIADIFTLIFYFTLATLWL